MALTFATNANNDIYLGIDGNLALDRGILATRDLCESTSKVRLGECIYNTAQGLPFFQAVFNGTPDINRYQAALLATLQAVVGVVRVTNISVTISQNILSYVATILTDLGITELGEEVPLSINKTGKN